MDQRGRNASRRFARQRQYPRSSNHEDSVKGPPITVRCDCGHVRAVPYGEAWSCEDCGRRWNTGQVPAEQYEAILERIRRFKIQAVRGGMVIAGVCVFLSIVVQPSILLLLPVALAIWYMWFWPRRRKEMREFARSSPTWNLRAE